MKCMTSIKALGLSSIGIFTVLIANGTCHAVKLKVMYVGLQKDAITKLATDYQKKTKHATAVIPIELKSFQDPSRELAQKPDIYIGNDNIMGSIADLGVFSDLRKIVPKKILADIMPTFLDAYSINGKLLALPLTGFLSDLEYNTKVFADNGLQPPSSTWTWSKQFYETCVKLSRDTNGDGIVDTFGVVGLPNTGYSSVIYGYGGTIADKTFTKVAYTQKPALEAINFVLKLHTEKLAEIYNWNKWSSSNQPFYNGNSAMELSYTIGEDEPARIESSVTAKAAPVPKGVKGSIPLLMGMSVGLLQNSPNKVAAVEFINYLLSVEGQSTCVKTMKCLPVTLTALRQKQIASFAKPELLKSYMTGKATGFRKDFSQLESSLWDDVLKLAKGTITREQFSNNALDYQEQLLTNTPYSIYMD